MTRGIVILGSSIWRGVILAPPPLLEFFWRGGSVWPRERQRIFLADYEGAGTCRFFLRTEQKSVILNRLGLGVLLAGEFLRTLTERDVRHVGAAFEGFSGRHHCQGERGGARERNVLVPWQ